MKNSHLVFTFALILSVACNQEEAEKQVGIEHEKEITATNETDLIPELLVDTLVVVERPATVKAEGNVKTPDTAKKEKPVKIVVKEEKPEIVPVIAEVKVPVKSIPPLSFLIKGSGNNIMVSGTSTLHDWTMTTASLAGNAQIQLDNADNLVSIDALTFTFPVSMLKSKDEKLDNNAHKTLNAEQYKTIAFKFTRSTITPQGNNKYTLKAVGSLTISGVTNEVLLDAVCVVNANNTMAITGTKSFNMSEFKIKPPQFMLGTMKTGDKVTINYNLLLAP